MNRLIRTQIAILAGLIMFFPGCQQEQTLGESCLSLYTEISKAPADSMGETDYQTYAHLKKPPLHPNEALQKFELEEGFRIELVASEPMVVDPVAMDIDADGRLWVINMPEYNKMPVRDILENTGERTEEREQALREIFKGDPQGKVVILEDTNGDGKMDTHRVFYEGIMMPRSIKVLNDGVLLGVPPSLLFIQDTNGDGKGDSVETLSDEYTTPRSPQSGPSALFRSMDNWIHSSHFPSLRRVDGQWQTKPFPPLGQWELAQDNWGRLYSSSNSWPLQMHMVPYGYGSRHPAFDPESGINTIIAPNEPIWPAHATGVNRGYRVGDVTREDGTLKIGAGISSTLIYRGDQFGEEYRNNVFTPVGSGNLIKRLILDSDPAEIETEARFAYENREFLTSTDERFRPVNIYNAPDGSIYVIDMYRGLYDFVLWVTDYLRDYSLEYGLDEPTGMFGRIYRIVRDDRRIEYITPKFSTLTPSEAVDYLRHNNGFLRDQAQQVLAECSPPAVIPQLEKMAVNPSEKEWTRLQALWTLEGISRYVYPQEPLTGIALNALDDPHPRVRAAALRLLEPALANWENTVADRLEKLSAEETAPYVQLQLLASLGESDSNRALHLMASILNRHPGSSYFREMALTGVYHREEQFAQLLRSEFGWNDDQNTLHKEFLASLSEAVEDRLSENLDHLTENQRQLYERGRIQYAVCSACHGTEGQGMSGIGSGLAGSNWVTGDQDVLLRIVLQGFDGGAAERGENIPNDMPGHAFLSDEDLAGILTYIRQSWGNQASPITPEAVSRIRSETSNRTEIWLPDELRELID